MTDPKLTLAAQAVLNAFLAEWPEKPFEQDRRCLSSALRAAADQMGCYHSKKFLYSIGDAMKLRAIATELEAL